jgi:hypothetical protein
LRHIRTCTYSCLKKAHTIKGSNYDARTKRRQNSSQKRTVLVKRLKISFIDEGVLRSTASKSRGLKVRSSGKEEKAETQEIRKGKPSV